MMTNSNFNLNIAYTYNGKWLTILHGTFSFNKIKSSKTKPPFCFKRANINQFRLLHRFVIIKKNRLITDVSIVPKHFSFSNFYFKTASTNVNYLLITHWAKIVSQLSSLNPNNFTKKIGSRCEPNHTKLSDRFPI